MAATPRPGPLYPIPNRHPNQERQQLASLLRSAPRRATEAVWEWRVATTQIEPTLTARGDKYNSHPVAVPRAWPREYAAYPPSSPPRLGCSVLHQTLSADTHYVPTRAAPRHRH